MTEFWALVIGFLVGTIFGIWLGVWIYVRIRNWTSDVVVNCIKQQLPRRKGQ